MAADRTVITNEESFNDRKNFVFRDIHARAQFAPYPSDTVMQQAGVMTETFLYIMGRPEASLRACTALMIDKRPPQGIKLKVDVALAIARIGQALRAGAIAISHQFDAEEVDQIISKKLCDSETPEIKELIYYYLSALEIDPPSGSGTSSPDSGTS